MPRSTTRRSPSACARSACSPKAPVPRSRPPTIFAHSLRCGDASFARSDCSRSNARTSILRQRELVEIFFVVVLHINLQRRENAHHRIVEADGQYQVREPLVIEALLQLAEGMLRD